MKKYFIYYNNGSMETADKLSLTLIHMVEVGVVKTIFDCEENKAWVRTDDGLSKEIKIPHVIGLS